MSGLTGIHEVAAAAGVTSRTLRHYDDIGLLPPTDVGANGYRFYDQVAQVRLHRILLLRSTGLSLSVIAEILAGQRDDVAALKDHREWLQTQRDELERRLAGLGRTIARLEAGEELMPDEVFDGFDHSRYREEVEQRWGTEAYKAGDRWWRGLADEQRSDFQQVHEDLVTDWREAQESGWALDDPRVQTLAARHTEWIAVGWGGRPVTADALRGLAEMYVADDRFSRHYGGAVGATFVRDALIVHSGSL